MELVDPKKTVFCNDFSALMPKEITLDKKVKFRKYRILNLPYSIFPFFMAPANYSLKSLDTGIPKVLKINFSTGDKTIITHYMQSYRFNFNDAAITKHNLVVT